MALDSARGSGPRLIALLKLIAEGGRSATLKDISARAGLPASSAHRLLQVLVQAGMVERGLHQTYRPGRELYRIAALLRSQFDLMACARPYLERLWAQWQETTVLCIYNSSNRTASVADAVLTPHPLRYAVEIGMELALPWGSLGRSMLAFLPDEDVDAAIEQTKVGPLSGRPLPPRSEIQSELKRIGEQGFADYFDPGFDVAGVAAPLFGANARLVGCIGITMPSLRYDLHDHAAMTETVRNAAQALSELIALQD